MRRSWRRKWSGVPVATAPSLNDLNGLDPREVVELGFFLKPEELDEATTIRKVNSNTSANKTVTRVICGLGGVYAAFMLALKE